MKGAWRSKAATTTRRGNWPKLMALAIDHRTHGLARQRIGNEDAPGGGLHDAVALLTDAIDGENFIHGELRRRNFSGLRLGDWHCSELGAQSPLPDDR